MATSVVEEYSYSALDSQKGYPYGQLAVRESSLCLELNACFTDDHAHVRACQSASVFTERIFGANVM
jgi:hypothetical protein